MNIKRITATTAATVARAIELMVADMSEMWDGFEAGKITKNSYGALVEVSDINAESGERETYNAYFYRAGDVVVCMPEIYTGEGYAMTGTDGNEYIVDEYGDMVVAE